MNPVYPMIFRPEEDGNGWCVFIPDLQGCVTHAVSFADGIDQMRSGICEFLYALEEKGIDVPPPSDPQCVETEPGDIVSLLDADMETHRRRAGSKAVVRTISIPQWMDILARQDGISLSQVTQDALRAQFHA